MKWIPGFSNRITLFLVFLIAVSHTSEAQPLKPSWSPDGKTIAFYNLSAGLSTIKILDVETGKVKPLIAGTNWAKFSPDSKSLYCVAGGSLYKVNIKTAQSVKVNSEGQLDHPSLSPDGQWLAFDKEMGSGTHDLHIMNLETGEVRQLVNTPNDEYHPSWSPDGKYILQDYGVNEEEPKIIRVNVRTKKIRILDVETKQMRQGHPSYSPDGKHIVFERKDELYIMSANGKDKRKVYEAPKGWQIAMATYSPDGSKLVFSELDEGLTEGRIKSINVDGSEVKVLFEAKR